MLRSNSFSSGVVGRGSNPFGSFVAGVVAFVEGSTAGRGSGVAWQPLREVARRSPATVLTILLDMGGFLVVKGGVGERNTRGSWNAADPALTPGAY
ncbi:hypothetical protein LO762_16065 [Actinocorallia sp. API 0066]|uniref:hypothetical protein n=1 Tax=Actinocorallia sp. API 0066 TaxID=2896846 RepID=UPI001E4EF5F7|nr:hypothetical protein [Actinocorallia sp. API 0066]MCD0450692.1 hypothetical protein [Actinocorallia sp. API 0066]